MNGRTIRVAVASLLICAGLVVVYVASRMASDDSEPAQTVHDAEYSDLTANPAKYLGKTVRVKAMIFGGPLSDPRLVNEQVNSAHIGYDFAPDAAEASAKLEAAFGPDVYVPHQAARCERALATVTGKFVEDGSRTKENGLSYRYWVIIHRLENVEACPRLFHHESNPSSPD
jgi:hypothetical protein